MAVSGRSGSLRWDLSQSGLSRSGALRTDCLVIGHGPTTGLQYPTSEDDHLVPFQMIVDDGVDRARFSGTGHANPDMVMAKRASAR